MANFVSQGLKEEGYDVDVAYDGKAGLELLMTSVYDILLLDLMIPEVDGLEGAEEDEVAGAEYTGPYYYREGLEGGCSTRARYR